MSITAALIHTQRPTLGNAAFSSLVNQVRRPDEIILLDNSVGESMVDTELFGILWANATDLGIRVTVTNSKRLPLSAARAKVAQYSSSTWTLLADDDTYYPPWYLWGADKASVRGPGLIGSEVRMPTGPNVQRSAEHAAHVGKYFHGGTMLVHRNYLPLVEKLADYTEGFGEDHALQMLSLRCNAQLTHLLSPKRVNQFLELGPLHMRECNPGAYNSGGNLESQLAQSILRTAYPHYRKLYAERLHNMRLF